MSWVEPFYSETGRWWGGAESAITGRDRERVASVRRLTGRTTGRLLDLGCSYGNTAAAFALAGWDVTGVEISERIRFGDRHLAAMDAGTDAGRLTLRHEDFTCFRSEHRFDVVSYFNGFGVGTDADQRALLGRVATAWLEPDGLVVLDVFNPTPWVRWAGDRSTRTAAPEAGYPYDLVEVTDYDPVGARFRDTWARADQPELRSETRPESWSQSWSESWSQSQRCYSPADLVLLLEPTGLKLVAVEVDDVAVDLDAAADRSHPLFDRHEYRVLLRRT